MFGPCLVLWMRLVTQCKRCVLPSRVHVGLPVMVLRWMLASVLQALAWGCHCLSVCSTLYLVSFISFVVLGSRCTSCIDVRFEEYIVWMLSN